MNKPLFSVSLHSTLWVAFRLQQNASNKFCWLYSLPTFTIGSVVTRFRRGRGTPCYDHLVQTVHNLIATSLMPRFVFLDVGTSLYVQCWLDCRRTPHVALTHSCQVSSRAFDAVQSNLSPITCTGLLLLSPLIRPQTSPRPSGLASRSYTFVSLFAGHATSALQPYRLLSRILQRSAKHSFTSAVYAAANPSVWLSVHPSVTLRYCVKTRERRWMRFSPSGSPVSLVFWRQEWLRPCLGKICTHLAS